MFKLLILNVLFLLCFERVFCAGSQNPSTQKMNQTDEVDSLNSKAYDIRLTDPKQTIGIAAKAFSLAKKAKNINGQAEACRVGGIGLFYLSLYEKALDKYLEAISYFEQGNNLQGIGKVYNNIGNLYSSNDYGKALEYYHKSLLTAKKFNDQPRVAALYVNIGLIQMKQKNYTAALEKFEISMKLFEKLNEFELIIQCMQNIGEVYNYLKQYQKAEVILQEALIKAKSQNLNVTIAGIDLSLSNVYLGLNVFDKAEEVLKNGYEYAKNLKNRDLQNDYNYSFYQLAYKRGNYKTALSYLKQNYSLDSAYYRQSFSKRITLGSNLFNQLQNRRKNERIIAQQKYANTLFWFSTAVAGLLFALVFLLVINVKRTNKSNQELTRLNAEVSKQKENLDRINHHLEDIIDERTKDLKIKNKTLSDYSLHLSHQIRGPIVTLKGIVYLEENGLIDQQECTQLIKKCVFEIDDEIISMSKLLNDDGDLNSQKT
ncbi:MAG: tetratricopeptide repeat protein [Sphingobacteriaceae bacterium]|nr:MAG: tetratricopeptide repeat protein [Sphingobacteriaceae bacterium]